MQTDHRESIGSQIGVNLTDGLTLMQKSIEKHFGVNNETRHLYTHEAITQTHHFRRIIHTALFWKLWARIFYIKYRNVLWITSFADGSGRSQRNGIKDKVLLGMRWIWNSILDLR